MGYLIFGCFIIAGAMFFIKAQMNDSERKASYIRYSSLEQKEKHKKQKRL